MSERKQATLNINDIVAINREIKKLAEDAVITMHSYPLDRIKNQDSFIVPTKSIENIAWTILISSWVERMAFGSGHDDIALEIIEKVTKMNNEFTRFKRSVVDPALRMFEETGVLKKGKRTE